MVAFGEEPKCVNLAYEVCHARPPTESEPYNKDPHHHKHIDRVRTGPPSQELRWLLHCILYHTILIGRLDGSRNQLGPTH